MESHKRILRKIWINPTDKMIRDGCDMFLRMSYHRHITTENSMEQEESCQRLFIHHWIF